MGFKGFKKTDTAGIVNHFDEVSQSSKMQNQMGRPTVDEYKKQNQRVQFYISQEIIDTLTPIAFQNGCKDVTAYAKKILIEEFEKVK